MTIHLNQFQHESYTPSSYDCDGCIVERPPQKRTITVSVGSYSEPPGKQVHIQFPYVQFITSHPYNSSYLLASMSKESVTDESGNNLIMNREVRPLYSCKSFAFCMGNFRWTGKDVIDMVDSAINHFWSSIFVNPGNKSWECLKAAQHQTKMGYSYDAIFDNLSIPLNMWSLSSRSQLKDIIEQGKFCSRI